MRLNWDKVFRLKGYHRNEPRKCWCNGNWDLYMTQYSKHIIKLEIRTTYRSDEYGLSIKIPITDDTREQLYLFGKLEQHITMIYMEETE